MEKTTTNNNLLFRITPLLYTQTTVLFPATLSLSFHVSELHTRRGNICDGWGCRWGAGTRVHLIPLMMSVAALLSATRDNRSPPLVRSLLHERPARQILPTYAGLIVFIEKKKSSKVVHLQTCAANLTSHLYLSERRWAPHRSAAKSVFLPFLSNVILIPYLADMQMCEVMMCLRGFFPSCENEMLVNMSTSITLSIAWLCLNQDLSGAVDPSELLVHCITFRPCQRFLSE